MDLWHLTNQDGRDGISREGFRNPPGPPEGPSDPAERAVWFARDQETARHVTWRTGWWVRVDAPDDLPEHLPGSGTYLVDAEIANTFPREFLPSD